MVVYDEVQQAFYNYSEQGRLSFDDVLSLVGDEATDAEVAARFQGMDLLPPYREEALRRLVLWHGAKKISEATYKRYSQKLRSAWDPQIDSEFCIEALRELVRYAFALYELLQNPGEHPVGESDLARFNAAKEPAETGAEGLVDVVAQFDVPACSYLQFLAEGCDSLAGRPFHCSCYVLPIDPRDDADPLVGWLLNESGATVEFAMHDLPDNETGYLRFLESLLKFLLDVHLHDAQIVTYGVGKRAVAAKHAVAAVWSCMRDGLDSGRAGVCRVCGKPFIAVNERKSKVRYCQQNGSCSRAFARVRKVLEIVESGAPLDDALDAVDGIGRKRFEDIARRNYHILSLEFGDVDMETFERKGAREGLANHHGTDNANHD